MICKTARKYIRLDLDGELNRQKWSALQKHLFKCHKCRQIQQQLLAVQSVMHELADISQPAVKSMPTIDFGQQTIWSWRTGMAAAAAIVLFFAGWWTFNIPQYDHRPQTVIVQTEKVDHPLAAAVSKLPSNIQVSFDNDVIAVPIKSDNPDVTILWVYPAIKTAGKSDKQKGLPDSTGKENNHEHPSKC
ncbi:MAG: hypothetical protein JSV03_14905 [Planctomycetota bacterium]|nr:MAG: hypothetical protein JSV03_14905 [Planctomycetota bacterium]